jgi:hypothetical protein
VTCECPSCKTLPTPADIADCILAMREVLPGSISDYQITHELVPCADYLRDNPGVRTDVLRVYGDCFLVFTAVKVVNGGVK